MKSQEVLESNMTIEIFSHDLSVRSDDDASDVFIITGKGWDNEPFHLYVNEEGARTLLWQLNFFLDNPSFQ